MGEGNRELVNRRNAYVKKQFEFTSRTSIKKPIFLWDNCKEVLKDKNNSDNNFMNLERKYEVDFSLRKSFVFSLVMDDH